MLLRCVSQMSKPIFSHGISESCTFGLFLVCFVVVSFPYDLSHLHFLRPEKKKKEML